MKRLQKDPDRAVLLLTYRDNDEAEEACALFNEAGIPTFIDSYYTNELLGKLIDVGGARLMVPNSRAAEAVELLRQNGKEVPHPERSTVGMLHMWLSRMPLICKLPEGRRQIALLFVVALLLFLLISLTYFFIKDFPQSY